METSVEAIDWAAELLLTDEQRLLRDESAGVQAAYKYLSDLPYTLWANWEIAHPDRRILAARWLDEQVRAVNRVRRKGDWNPV